MVDFNMAGSPSDISFFTLNAFSRLIVENSAIEGLTPELSQGTSIEKRPTFREALVFKVLERKRYDSA
jgi:hypothetical protein